MPDADRAIKLVFAGRYRKKHLMLPDWDDDFQVFGLSASRNPHVILFGDANNKCVNALNLQNGRVWKLLTSHWTVNALRWMRSAEVLAILQGKGGGMQVVLGFASVMRYVQKQLEVVV